MSFPASTGRYYQLLYATNGPALGWSVSNLGWGTTNMKVTNQVGAVWSGGVQVRLSPPHEVNCHQVPLKCCNERTLLSGVCY